MKADYYYKKVIDGIEFNLHHNGSNYGVKDINQTFLDKLHKYIESIIKLNREYLLTDGFIYYTTMEELDNPSSYIGNVCKHYKALIGNDNEAIEELQHFYYKIRWVDHWMGGNSITIRLQNLTANNENEMWGLKSIDLVLRDISYSYSKHGFKSLRLMLNVLITILVYCVYYKKELDTYSEYVTDFCYHINEFVDKLIVSGVCSVDDASDDKEYNDEYIGRLVTYLMTYINEELEPRIKID